MLCLYWLNCVFFCIQTVYYDEVGRFIPVFISGVIIIIILLYEKQIAFRWKKDKFCICQEFLVLFLFSSTAFVRISNDARLLTIIFISPPSPKLTVFLFRLGTHDVLLNVFWVAVFFHSERDKHLIPYS